MRTVWKYDEDKQISQGRGEKYAESRRYIKKKMLEYRKLTEQYDKAIAKIIWKKRQREPDITWFIWKHIPI